MAPRCWKDVICVLMKEQRWLLGPAQGRAAPMGARTLPKRKTPKQEPMQQGCVMASAVWL